MPGTPSEGAGGPPSSPTAIEQVFADQESELLLYAQRLVRHDDVAQDLVQEAFLRLHAEFAGVRQPRAWLYRTVHNLAMNHLRADRKTVALHSEEVEGTEPADSHPLPDEQIQRMEAIGQTRLCLAALDARSRELLRLKFEENLSYKEMSARANLSVSNVGYLLHHALKHLAAELKKSGAIP